MEKAAAVLVDHGFSQQASGKWVGEIQLPNESVTVEIALPPDFPDKLPEIVLAVPGQTAVRSHVEQSGKICIAPSSGNLLDTDRPAALLTDSIDRASSVLCASEEKQKTEVQLEFVAYWPEKSSDAEIWSIVDPSRAGREVAFATISLNGTHLLFADSEEMLRKWTRNSVGTCGEIKAGYFAQLSRLPNPPPFEQTISTQELDDLLSLHMSEREYEKWKKWDGNRRPPPAMLIACELDDGSFTVVAARRARLNKEQERAIRNPYKRKRPPAKKVREALTHNPVRRRGVTRLDLPHLLNRTGGALDFDDASIAVVGCGAVGSQIAVAAAALGVKYLTLIDNESMSAENIHRHALGASDLKKPKAVTLAKLIQGRFPHSEVTPRMKTIEEVFDSTPEILDDVDLFVFALGDETLERRINSYLGSSAMRLHSWVEPLGVGGHCLIVPGGDHKGCYECLYARDDNLILYNMSSLCARGQVFQRTTGGCAGTFTPFGYVDTLDVASKTARMMVSALTDKSVKHGLLSWIGDERKFLDSGFKLSKRGESLLTPREVFRGDVFRDDCKVCANW